MDGFFSTIGALALIVIAQGAAADTGETPATPLNRTAPDYPFSCRPALGDAVEPQQVIVTFTVTRDGQTENIRVRESTDSCFNEVAIAAARLWTYEPRRVNGVRQSQEDLEVTITFVWDGETQTEEFDARPILRVPPKYPDRCMSNASKRETVLIEFDVTTEGATENVRAVKSSSRCFERSAIKAVSKWRYHPKTISGVPVERTGVQTQITFELGGYSENFRRTVRARLRSVQRSLRREGGAPEALEKLAEIEAKYGDSFTQEELTSFHQLRAAARIEVGDYRGALDDLRIVQSSSMPAESVDAIDKAVVQLEAAIAAEELAAKRAADAAAAEQSEEPE